MKDIDKVTLTYNDSHNPGKIVLDVQDERPVRPGMYRAMRLTLSAAEAVSLAERLLVAVRYEGYDLTARRRSR